MINSLTKSIGKASRVGNALRFAYRTLSAADAIDRKDARRGLTTIEILASASIIGLLVTTTTTLGLRIRKLDQDAQFEMMAIQELANALENEIGKHYEQLNAPESEGTTSISVSELLSNRWPDASIVPIYEEDSLGRRITLQLYRSKLTNARPIELSGWIVAPSQEASASSPSDQSPPETAPGNSSGGTGEIES